MLVLWKVLGVHELRQSEEETCLHGERLVPGTCRIWIKINDKEVKDRKL